MRNMLLAILPIALFGCQPSQKPSGPQSEAEHLARKTGCFACHAIEKKLLGPPWRDVAMIYSTDPEAEDKLVQKFMKGGSGVWGTIAMPGYPHVSEENLRILAKYVLSMKDKG